MILTYDDIISRGLIDEEKPARQRKLTSYDATVGNIICDGLDWKRQSFLLKPRSVVWIKSAERFVLPNNITALATLKTTWTHRGILALNVGIVDPGWEGPLSTVIVNFSKVSFPIHVGDPFFRLAFFEHEKTSPKKVRKSHEEYLNDTLDNSVRFSETFLTMDTLSKEISEDIFKAPSWAPRIGFYSLLLALIAIFAPVAYQVFSSSQATSVKIEQLENAVSQLCSEAGSCSITAPD